MNGASVRLWIDLVGGEMDVRFFFCSESVKIEATCGGAILKELRLVSESASGGGDDERPSCFVGDKPNDDMLEGLNLTF